MRKTIGMKTGLMAGLLSLVWSHTASASVSYSSQFGAVQTNVGIGVHDNRVFFVEQRVSDNACKSQAISNTPDLTDIIFVSTGNGPNRVRVATQGWPVVLCGFSLEPIQGNRFYVSIKGGDGTDIIMVEGRSSAQGGNGDDIILALGTATITQDSGRLWGDWGNDWIIQALGQGRHDMLIGGTGDDHLCDLGDGSEIYGGDGRDYWWNYNDVLDKAEVMMPSVDDCNNLAFAVYVTQTF